MRFDIEATVANTPATEVIPMASKGAELLRSLLEDRFKLQTHFETRPMQVYSLVRVKADALGPNLHRSSADCEALARAARENPTGPVVDSNLRPS